MPRTDRFNDDLARSSFVIGALFAIIAICWILLTPPGAGPDEASHFVRGAALAHGQWNGEDLGRGGLELFDLSDVYILPDAACYAFQPTVSVACAAPTDPTGATVALASRAEEYPIWGQLPGGLMSRLPGLDPIWWARLAGAAVPVALIIWSVLNRRRDGPLAMGALLLCVTPMAWATFAAVNPSAMSIGGAIALWSGLIGNNRRSSSSDQWLLACGWAALALPRRDGLIWAFIVLSLVLIAHRRPFVEWWHSLAFGPRLVMFSATAAAMLWGITSDSRVSRLVALAPTILVVVEAMRWASRRTKSTAQRRLLVTGVAAAAAISLSVVLSQRPGGWDGLLAEQVIGQTGNNTIEAIGRLGWLDVPLPWLLIVAWLIGFGMLGAGSLLHGPRAMSWVLVLIIVAATTSWIFELFQGNTSGQYWQGRYSLPLLVGAPLLFGAVDIVVSPQQFVGRWVGILSLVVMNVAAWSAARRWGVGVEGSLVPWDWDTPHAPLHPAILLAVLACCSAGLAGLLLGANVESEVGPESDRWGVDTQVASAK